MKKFILTISVFVAMSGCGKKQDDAGAQFSVKALGDFQTRQDGVPTAVIVREDENAGPTFKIEGDMNPVQYFDKSLICGPVTILARRALKTDSSFLNFKVSESEFHGMNQLPQHTDCILRVTSANAAGSTVTKNFPVELKFDSSPSLKIYREYLAPKITASLASATITMDYYEITNPFSYPAGLLYRNSQTFTAIMFFKAATAYRGSTYASALEIEPTNVEYTGSFETGYRIKVPANSTIKIRAVARLVGPYSAAECSMDFTSPLIGLQVLSVDESTPSLIQAAKFDFSSEDLTPGRTLNTKQLTSTPLRFSPARNQFNCPPPQFGGG